MQELLDHTNVSTAVLNTHVLNKGGSFGVCLRRSSVAGFNTLHSAKLASYFALRSKPPQHSTARMAGSEHQLPFTK